MDKVSEKNQRAYKQPDTDLFLQWGNRKRLRCVRVRDPEVSDPSYSVGGRIRRKITSSFVTGFEKELPLPPSTRLTRNSETATLRSENNRKLSPEKEDKHHSTRGSGSAVGLDENGVKVLSMEDGGKIGGVVWPKLYITLSSKEKEEDFMAMKGCKLPQRPKKRAKIIQRTLLLVSPGEWLTELCQERYEMREKKSSKKRPRARGLKAMGSMESDSE